MKSYYNTTSEAGQKLLNYNKQAQSQNEVILSFFRLAKNRNKEFTPMEVSEKTKILFTSVRRALSWLTDTRKLVKTENKKQGKFGRPNYTWKLKYNNK